MKKKGRKKKRRKEKEENIIKDIRNFFRLKKETKVIKDRKLQDRYHEPF